MTITRTHRTYTTDEIAKLEELADIARQLEVRHNNLILAIEEIAANLTNSDPIWFLRTQKGDYPELMPLIDIYSDDNPTLVAYWKLRYIKVGRVLVPGENPKAWAKANNKYRRWLEKLEAALVAVTNKVHFVE